MQTKITTLMMVIFVLCVSKQLYAQQRLTVESVPESRLSIDGKPYGKTPKKNIRISAGTHSIHLKRIQGREETEFQIAIPQGKNFKCSYFFGTGNLECASEEALSRTKDKTGYLKLSSEPESDAYVDGVKVGKTPVEDFKVNSGRHQVEFRIEGYDSVFKDVSVEDGQTITVESRFSKQNSTPDAD